MAKKSKYIVRRYPTPNGWAEKRYIDPKACDEENMRVLKHWGPLTFWEKIKYKILKMPYRFHE